MTAINAIIDDEGKTWEIEYNERLAYVLGEDGEPLLDGDGLPILTSRVESFRYRLMGETAWLTLPPWATIQDDWLVNLCFFDEDDETGELTFWQVRS